MPCSAGYAPVMIVEVAAGVIDGNIVTERVCMAPAPASARMTGSRPVWTAGQTTCGVAASMTTSRTFDATTPVYTRGLAARRAGGAGHEAPPRVLSYLPPAAGAVVYWYLPSFSIFIASSIAAFSSRSNPVSSSSGVFSAHTSGATPKFSRLMR